MIPTSERDGVASHYVPWMIMMVGSWTHGRVAVAKLASPWSRNPGMLCARQSIVCEDCEA